MYDIVSLVVSITVSSELLSKLKLYVTENVSFLDKVITNITVDMKTLSVFKEQSQRSEPLLFHIHGNLVPYNASNQERKNKMINGSDYHFLLKFNG